MTTKPIAKWQSITIVVLFLLCVLIYGGLVTTLIFCEPDVCFLLAMGRAIVQSGAIPTVDPFAFSAAPSPAMPGVHYVVYQWLFEVLVYQLYAWWGYVALVALAALVETWAFGLGPYRIANKFGITGWRALALVTLISVGSVLRLSLRPDIFNQAFTVIVLEVLLWRLSMSPPVVSSSATASGGLVRLVKSMDWTFVVALSGIALLWANLHCLFVLCFVHLGFANIASILTRSLSFSRAGLARSEAGDNQYKGSGASESLDYKSLRQHDEYLGLASADGKNTGSQAVLEPPSRGSIGFALGGQSGKGWFGCLDHSLLAALVVCFAATCINPYGPNLWLLLPSIFFNPINAMLNEQQPVSLSQGFNLSLIPFVVLVVLNCVFAVKALISIKDKTSPLNLELVVFALLQFGFAAGLTFIKLRFIAIALIMLAASLAVFYRASQKPQLVKSVSAADAFLAKIFSPRKLTTNLVWLTSAVLGAVMLVINSTPMIPRATPAFLPPFKAVDYLIDQYHGGRILNTLHFADMLMWTSKKPMATFIDSRYFLYDRAFWQRYQAMINCQGDWLTEFERWRFRYVFVDSHCPLALALANNPSWQKIFADQHVVIYLNDKNPQTR